LKWSGLFKYGKRAVFLKVEVELVLNVELERGFVEVEWSILIVEVEQSF